MPILSPAPSWGLHSPHPAGSKLPSPSQAPCLSGAEWGGTGAFAVVGLRLGCSIYCLADLGGMCEFPLPSGLGLCRHLPALANGRVNVSSVNSWFNLHNLEKPE